MATNTDPDEYSRNSIPSVNEIKHLVEVFTQTDDDQIDLKKNENISSDKISDSEDEPAGWENDRINPRFDQNVGDREEFEWILNEMDAVQFSVRNQSLIMSIGPLTPAMVVDAMEKSGDLKHLPKKVWKLLNMGRKTGDATYLIRAYTAESDFYKILNKKLARQTLGNPMGQSLEDQLQTTMGNIFTQFGQAISAVQAFQAGQQMQQTQNNNETDWAKLFLKVMYQLIMTPNSSVRYEGITYRGMRLTLQELEHYDPDRQYVCNKAITSTSKLRSVAQEFIDSGPRPEDMYDVMFIYDIETISALLAIDIHAFSLMKQEEEVLIMPGILFKVKQFTVTSPHSVEIQLHSAFKDFLNGSFSNALTELFSAFQPDLD